MTKKEYISNALNKIEFVAKTIPAFGFIVRNYNKGYKPAKDFVKNLARKIEEKEFSSNIDIINYLTNLPPSEIVPHTYSKYPKA